MAQDNNKHNNDQHNPMEPDWAKLLDQLEANQHKGVPLTDAQWQQLEELHTLIAETSDAWVVYAQLDVDKGWQALRAAALERQLIPANDLAKVEKRLLKSRPLWRRMVAAASLVFVLSIGVYHYYQQQNKANYAQILVESNVQPGSNRATLTLANGNQIDLKEDQGGIVMDAEGIKYRDGSAIASYNHASTLILTTPKGGQYQVTLPDGTKVWLNAASTLKYPSRFIGKDRRVELKGEAYFEVVKQRTAKTPFIVSSEGQEVLVLGTHFNINTYNEKIKTTLLEGSVKVSTAGGARMLIPGQQATFHTGSNTLDINTVDTKTAVAWKEGLIILDKQNIRDVLAQLERWYDVEFVNPEAIKAKDTHSGEIPRNIPLAAVLEAIGEQLRVKFDIKGRRIMIVN